MNLPMSQTGKTYPGIQPGLVESLRQEGYRVCSVHLRDEKYSAQMTNPDSTVCVKNLDSHEVANLLVALCPRPLFEAAKQLVKAHLPGVNS